jgi:hypothetical protein
VEGTLCADSLWWPAGEDYSEWILLDVTFCANAAIHGGSGDIRYSGSLDAEDGLVRYLHHDFPIQSFQITFLDSTLFDPVVDLIAEAPVRSNAGVSYLVRFDLTGPASLARPQLSTEPGLGRQDIESLLALGIPLSAFSDEYVRQTEGSYWAQQVFMFRAMEVAADRMVGIAEQRAQRVLGMDEVYVPTARGLASGDAEMGVAKRLGRRATLSYNTPMWHLGAYRARLDFRLTDHFSLESESDHTGDSGVDLRFKVRWR